jgi:hypothetical protein
MAETIVETKAPVPFQATNDPVRASNIFNLDTIKKHLEALTENLKTFIGRQGVNAHLWKATHIQPLIDRLNNGETSNELHNKILSIPLDVVPLAPGAEHNAANPMKQPQAAGAEIPEVTPAKVIVGDL